MAGMKALLCLSVICGSASICMSQGMDMLGLAMMSGGMGGGMSPADFAMLDSAVKYIVGPHASPDAQIINLANQQGGPPRTLFEVMPYVHLFQALGQRVGVANVPQRPALPSTGNLTIGQMAQLMRPLPSANDVVMSRAVEWFNRNQAMTAGGMFF